MEPRARRKIGPRFSRLLFSCEYSISTDGAAGAQILWLLAGLDDFHHRVMPWSRSDPAIAGDQRSFEQFCQGHVNGVIRRQGRAEFPHSRHQEIVRITMKRKVSQILEGLLAALSWNGLIPNVTAEHLGHLDIQKMGGMERHARRENAFLNLNPG